MSELKFRNVDASPLEPVEDWPFEAISAAVERGTLPDRRRLAAAINQDPWGPVAEAVAEAVEVSGSYGTTELMREVIARARRRAAASDRAEVATEIRAVLARSGLNQAEFARRVGTLVFTPLDVLVGNGVPSAALLVRMRRVPGAGGP